MWKIFVSMPICFFNARVFILIRPSDHPNHSVPQPLIAAQRVRAALKDLRAEIVAMDVRIGVATAAMWEHQMRAQRQPVLQQLQQQHK